MLPVVNESKLNVLEFALASLKDILTEKFSDRPTVAIARLAQGEKQLAINSLSQSNNPQAILLLREIAESLQSSMCLQRSALAGLSEIARKRPLLREEALLALTEVSLGRLERCTQYGSACRPGERQAKLSYDWRYALSSVLQLRRTLEHVQDPQLHALVGKSLVAFCFPVRGENANSKDHDSFSTRIFLVLSRSLRDPLSLAKLQEMHEDRAIVSCKEVAAVLKSRNRNLRSGPGYYPQKINDRPSRRPLSAQVANPRGRVNSTEPSVVF